MKAHKLVVVRGHHIYQPGLDSASVVLDAGAHRGEFSRTLARIFGCQCYAFEPNPALFKALPTDGKCMNLPWALSGSCGKARFELAENPEAGHLQARADSQRGTIEVETVTMAAAMERLNLTEVDLLRLDVEGAEFDIFAKTSDELLQRIGQITVEFHDFLKGCGTAQDVRRICRRLTGLGFLCCKMSFRTNGDLLFINTRQHEFTTLQRIYLSCAARFLIKARLVSDTAGA